MAAVLNVQTLPRSDKVVKTAFVPKLHAFMLCDYPNIELKVLAFFLDALGWPSMAEAFRQGADLHVVTACGVLGRTLDFEKYPEYGISDDDRQIGKKLNFSIVYGGGIPTLIRQLGITAPEALELLRNYHATWPGIGWETKGKKKADPGTLIAGIKEQLDSRGYITTLYGRHLHPRMLHAALNNLCQGTAADLMKWAMVRVHQGLQDFHPLLSDNGNLLGYVPAQSHIVNMVHDELVLDCTRGELPRLAVAVPDWMTDERLEAVVPIRPGCDVSYTTLADKAPYQGD